jgi:predicted DNA-binding transcriptional regulator YafY
MSTSGRLLRLLSLLQTPRDWTGGELAARLEVSPRTVRNDIERLRALGYPVHATRGSVGGYRLEAGASMPPLLLDDEEAVAVALGLRTATAGAVTGIEESSLRALAKLEQVLPPRLRRQVSTLQGVTQSVIRRRPGAPAVHPAMLTELARLARERFALRFDYSDRRQEASQRRVEPYRIVNAGARWYLIAWDMDRADWRTFRIDRIRPGMSAGARFTPRQLTDAEVEALIARGVPPEARRHQARVVVQLPAGQLAERFGPWVGRIEPLDETSCLLTTGAERVEDLAAWLGFLGADFQVTEPPELLKQLRVLADRYAAAGKTQALGSTLTRAL